MSDKNKILLVGFGMFGQGLACAMARREDIAVSVLVRSMREVPGYVDKVFLPGMLSNIEEFKAVMLAVPSFAIEDTLHMLKPLNGHWPPLISCAKGLDPASAEFTSQVIFRATGTDQIGVLIGASFADEMIAGKAVQLTLACANLRLGEELASYLRTDTLHIGTSSDVRGLEVIGVAKNILAIGAGMVTALGLGENFRATYIAKGITETAKVIKYLGGYESTILDLGALSDVILTCSSVKSRNFQCGMQLVDPNGQSGKLAEGKHSALLFCRILQSYGIRSVFFETIARAMDKPQEVFNVFD